jgi:hypothetical protein
MHSLYQRHWAYIGTLSALPADVFRTIFARYFGADLPPLADQLFYWDKADEQGRPAESNKRFVDVTARLAE